MPCISLTFFVNSCLLAGRELPLFYTVGIFDEGAYHSIGNNFGAILFVLIGAFDDVLVYFNELFHSQQDGDTERQSALVFFQVDLANAAPWDVAPRVVLAL